MLPIMRKPALFFLFTLGIILSYSPFAQASSEKMRLYEARYAVEQQIQKTEWHFNNIEEKRALEERLKLIDRIINRVTDYESGLMALDCNGVTINLDTGRARTDEDPFNSWARPQGRALPGLGGLTLDQWFLSFARRVTDREVRLVIELALVEDRIARGDWGFANLDELEQLREVQKSQRELLKRLRASRC